MSVVLLEGALSHRELVVREADIELVRDENLQGLQALDQDHVPEVYLLALECDRAVDVLLSYPWASLDEFNNLLNVIGNPSVN